MIYNVNTLLGCGVVSNVVWIDVPEGDSGRYLSSDVPFRETEIDIKEALKGCQRLKPIKESSKNDKDSKPSNKRADQMGLFGFQITKLSSGVNIYSLTLQRRTNELSEWL